MVIVPSRIGQLGNQLFHTAHFAAAAIEHHYRFRFASFEFPLEHFPEINSNPLIQVRQTSVAKNRWQRRAFKILNSLPASPLHRCLVSDELPHLDPADTLFRFSDPIHKEVDKFERKEIGGTDSQKIGFHIRRGDFREYEGGRYFLEDAAWLDLIEEIRNEISAAGKQFTGILFSNEDIDGLLGSSNDLVAGPGGLYTDMEMMSRCDRLVAPPSTFSGWASFLGRVPALKVERNGSPYDPEMFRVTEW